MSMTSSSYFSPELLGRTQQSTIIVDGKMYSWGGQRLDMPLVHDSVDKMKLISFVEVFDIPSLSWSKVPTAGIPPTAVMGYSSANINNEVFFFGGCCKPHNCCHNDTFVLNAASKEWSQVLYANAEMAPMKKVGHCMISFSSDKEDYLLVVGGYGSIPTTTPSHSMYTCVLSYHSFTNETHVLCVSSSPARWIVPVVTGTRPPPSAWFTLNKLPDNNRAILFGGQVIDHSGHHFTNDAYIVTYSKDSVDYIKLDSSLEYLFNYPKGRYSHSSAVLTANDTHHLLVIGGLSDLSTIVGDCWILDIDKNRWRKIDLPFSVTDRADHSVSIFTVSDNCVWLLITGGYSCYRQVHVVQVVAGYVTGPDAMMIVELVYSDEWRVTNVWNSEQLISEKSHILSRLGQHSQSDKPYRETNIGSIMMTGTEEFRIWLKEKENELLREDLRLSRIKNEEYQKTLLENKKVEEVYKKMLLVKSQELKKLRETKDVCKIDVGVQFNYASLETDHLQDVTISSSKLFTVHGNRPQSLIWPGHGFELHFPANTCLPGEECDIMVDAVVGGDFVFPEGVEPVSAIYIISITSKLRMPSLLKIQHCVALDKASKHSRLSFYRALLKEPKPPYHFRRVKGGKFDTNSQFGELELPAFCSMGIGKDSPTSSEDESGIGSARSNTSSSCSDLEQEDQILLKKKEIEGTDNSIMYFGQVFYMKKHLNEWEMKFIVVKHIEAFTTYVKSKLKQYEENVQVNIRFSTSHIELVLDREEAAKGWSIEPYSEPLVVSLKLARGFGYEKEVTVPPTCMVDVYCDNSITDYVRRLRHPVFLKGALIGDGIQEPKIYIKRTMTEKDDRNLVQQQQSSHDAVQDAQYPPSLSEGPSVLIQQNPASIDTVQASAGIDEMINCIKEEINKKFPALQTLFDEDSLKVVAAEMLAAGIIAHHVANNPSFSAIINGFLSSFSFFGSKEEIEDWCNRFLNALHNVGGPFVVATNNLKKELKSSLMKKCNVKFNI